MWKPEDRTFIGISAKLLAEDQLDKIHEEEDEKAFKALAARVEARGGSSTPSNSNAANSSNPNWTKKPCQNPNCTTAGKHHTWANCWAEGGGRAGHEKEDRKKLEKRREEFLKKEEKKKKSKGKGKEKAAAAKEEVEEEAEESDNSPP
ncbi:hypothetical protein P7C70_g7471, partial [Phenoliferia sp. Uapishka_3]